jgi:hypothetical protein
MVPDERIEHDAPENLAGPLYGQVVKYTQRHRKDVHED